MEGHVLNNNYGVGDHWDPYEIGLLSFPFDATALQSVPSVSEESGSICSLKILRGGAAVSRYCAALPRLR